MKKLISRLLVILMVFSLTFGSIGVTMPKAVEEENKGQALKVLGPNDEFDTTNAHDNFLDYDEMYGPLSAPGIEQQNATKKITESEINPVVVLIDFPSSESDPTKGKLKVNSIYPSSTVTAINSAFSGTTNSLKDYVSKVSGGKCIINPFFSYNINNNTYVYIADHPKEYYMPYDSSSNPTGYKNLSEQSERTQLLIDAFAAIKDYIPSNMDLDADDNGYIDAVDFFVPYQTDWNTFLWPHKWSVKTDTERKTEVDGAILSTYNLITASYFNGAKYQVITHEFMHTLGFPDMYIYYSGTFSDPIGNWTMMSGNTGYPTVRERIRYGGWISESNIPTISKNGTYTVKGSTLDSTKNTIAYKVTVPNSNEFFMIEYRDKSANAYEAKVPATGLIVYRVDPDRSGNTGGDPEIYVLRNSGQGSYQAYLDGTTNHKSLDLVLSSGESTGYKVEYVSNTSGEAKFKLINNSLNINSFISSNGISLSVGDTTRFTINASSGEGELKYSIDVNGKYILKDSTNYQADWTPNEAGTYTITAKVVDSNNNVATATKTITVSERNETTIYYKGYDNPYIHYQIGNGSWTNAPGVKMTASSDVDGYDYKATIKLNGAKTLTACFNNGNGSWDSRNGQNYTFNEGYYTYSNGVIKKIPRPESKIAISSFTTNPSSETTVSRIVTISASVTNNKGLPVYTYEAKDSSGNVTKIAENTTESSVNWQPQKAGKYTLIVTASDVNGDTATSEKEFTVNGTITLNKVTFNKTSPIYVGDELKATVSFNGGTGKKKCTAIRAQGGNYQFGSKEKYFTMNSDSSGTWKPDMDGTYSILAIVEDESGYTTMIKIGEYEVKNKALEITSITSSAGTTIKNGEPTEITINAVGGKGSYTYELYYSLYGSGRTYYILNGTSTNKGTFTPNYPQDWTLYAKVTDEEGNTATKQLIITAKDVTSNITTIYYKGYDNPYIHYQIGNGSWTNAPGVKMTACNDVDGYYYKAEIDLGDATTLTACFNNGNGSWDSNNGQNYTFGVGYYTYSNGNINKIDEPNKELKINSIEINNGSNIIYSGEENTIKINATGGEGTIKYSIDYKSIAGNGSILTRSESNIGKWTPSSSAVYELYISVQDDSALGWDSYSTTVTVVERPVEELEITSVISSKGTTMKKTDTTIFTINAKGGKGKYTYSLSTGSGYGTWILVSGSTDNKISWTPDQNYPAKTWELTVTVKDEEGNTASKLINVTTTDVTSNITTIYYKGYDNPYIHYQIGNGSWTEVPGVKMTACTDVSGYYYKAEIDLGDATTLTACFNNGNGSWDSRNGQNYSFGVGSYTYSNGVITKIDN